MTKGNLISPGHASKKSQGSDTTGFADSTLSFGESIQLSQFPLPPPTLSVPLEARIPPLVQNSPSLSYNTPRTARSSPVRKLPAVPAAGTPTLLSQPSPSVIRSSASSSKVPSTKTSSAVVSAHDWHEGASSIDVDATEDRLLPTSFITSLLRENKGPLIGQRTSYSSDAVSGISEMTYPPINLHSVSHRPIQLPGSEQKPQGARPPPPSYHRRPWGPNDVAPAYVSSVTDAQFVVGEARYSDKVLVGITPAIRHRTSLNGQANPTGMDGFAYKRRSTSSVKTSSPSILSRISSRKSIKAIFTRTKVKPLPPVPLIPDIPISMEREHRKAEEETPLPELMQRAGTLQDLLERGYHPHDSLVSSRDELIIKDILSSTEHTSTQIPSRQIGDSNRQLSYATMNRAKVWLSRRMADSSRPMSRSERAKHWLVNLAPLLILVVVVIAVATAVTASQRAHHSSVMCQGNLTGAACDLGNA